MLLFGERDLEDISKISKKTLSSSVQLGKRKLLDDRVVDLQKIIDKMVSVDKIVNEFHTLGLLLLLLYSYYYFEVLSPHNMFVSQP